MDLVLSRVRLEYLSGNFACLVYLHPTCGANNIRVLVFYGVCCKIMACVVTLVNR